VTFKRLRENVRRLRSELWRQKNWLLHHDNAPRHTSIFTRELLTVPTHPTFQFPRLKIKLKGLHFDTTEVIEAESQAVMNTLTEHNFQDAFKNGRSDGNGECEQRGTTMRMRVVCRPNASTRIWSDGNTSPGNYGLFFVGFIGNINTEIVTTLYRSLLHTHTLVSSVTASNGGRFLSSRTVPVPQLQQLMTDILSKLKPQDLSRL
jgi:hypothetical protein